MAIKISKNLKKYAFYDPTKESTNMSISALCELIERNDIALPIFQTYLRWTKEKSVSLLNFQLTGKAPVSPISINRIKDNVNLPQVTFIDRLVLGEIKGKLSVNDGQQRLSCNYFAYTDHEDFKDIFLDLAKGAFVINTDKRKRNQIPVGKLYNKNSDEYSGYIEKNPELQKFEISSLLSQIRTKFFNYYYTVNFASDLTEEEQVEWFEVLNLAGSRVPFVQMKLTQLLIKGVDFYKDYTKVYKGKLEEYGFDHLFPQKDTEISIPLATLNPSYEIFKKKSHASNYSPIASDAKESQICNLEPNDLKSCIRLTLTSLDKALDFINVNSLKNPKRIDHITYLVGLFVYLGESELSETQSALIIDWYNSVIFSNKTNQQRRALFDELIKIRNK